MISNIIWFLNKNKPSKLHEIYYTDDLLKALIIDRLMQLGELDYLLEIAKSDRKYRADIIMQLAEESKLRTYHIEEILRWLPFSQLYEKILSYIKKEFTKEQIALIKKKFKLISIRRKTRKNVLSDMKVKQNELIDVDYLKLKEIVKSFKPIKKKQLDIDADEPATAFEDFLEFQYFEKDKKNEYDILKQFLKVLLQSGAISDDMLLSIFNLAKLTRNEKIKMLVEMRDSRLYYPEYYELLTEFSIISMQDIRDFFSMTIVLDWLKKFLRSHWLLDLHSFMLTYQEESDWIKKEIKRFSNFEDIAKISQKNTLFQETAYTLIDIIPEQKIIAKLEESVEMIIHQLSSDMNSNDSFFFSYINKLFWIGGRRAHEFIGELLRKEPVKDYNSFIEKIEAKYNFKKEEIESADEIAELIEEEINDKNRVISESKYLYIVSKYLDMVVKKRLIHPELREVIIENIPDLKPIFFTSNQKNQIKLIKFIAIVGLRDYAEFLNDRITNDDNNSIRFYAALALVNISPKSLKQFVEMYHGMKGSKEKLLAQNLYFIKEMDKGLLIELANHHHIGICKPALDTIASYPLSKAINIFYAIVRTNEYENTEQIVRTLKKLNSEETIPLLIELNKSGGFINKLEFVRSLGMINTQRSIKILENITTKDRFILGIEKARALIRLGQAAGWKSILGFMEIKVDIIQQYAKIAFIKHCNSVHLPKLKELIADKDNLVSIYALSKLSLYNDEDTWQYVSKIIFSEKQELQFYLSIFLSYFPIEKSKEHVKKLYRKGGFDSKMVCALLMLRSNDDTYLEEITDNVMSYSKIEQNEILKALKEFNQIECLPILEKILLLQNPDQLNIILKIFLKLDETSLVLLLFQIWKLGDDETKEIIAEIFPEINDYRVLPFIRKQIENCNDLVKAKLAYALVLNGEDDGWKYLETMFMKSEDFSSRKAAIAMIAKIGTPHSIDLFMIQMRSPDDKLKAEVIKGIGKINNKESFTIIKGYTKSPSNSVRIAVANTLGNLFYPEVDLLLKEMLEDSDDYVRVAAEVALEKQDIGFTPRYNLKENMEEILKFDNWKLNIRLQKNLAKEFKKKYRKTKYIKLTNFESKVIMEVDDKKAKIESLKDELTKKLTGTSNVDAIMKAKEEFKSEVVKYVTVIDLVNSILHFDIKKASEEEVEIIKKTIFSNKKIIIKTLLVNSIMSNSRMWLDIIEKITDDYEIDNDIIDMLIFSIIRHFSPISLRLLCKLFHLERARYYFVIITNYYFLHLKNISKISIEKSITALQNSSAKDVHKNSAEKILRKLLNKKIESEKKK